MKKQNLKHILCLLFLLSSIIKISSTQATTMVKLIFILRIIFNKLKTTSNLDTIFYNLLRMFSMVINFT